MGQALNNVAGFYHSQGKYAEAGFLYERALKITEKGLGPNHHNVAAVLGNMANCYREMGRKEEAEKLEARAKKIQSNK